MTRAKKILDGSFLSLWTAAVTLIILMALEPALAQSQYINLHTQGAGSSRVQARLTDGVDVVAVLRTGRYWVKVQIANGMVGWVRKNEIGRLDLPGSASNNPDPATPPVDRSHYIPLYTGGNEGSRVQALLRDGVDVTSILHRGHYWDKVRLSNGMEGWIRKTQMRRLDLPTGESQQSVATRAAPSTSAASSSAVSQSHGGLSSGESRVSRGSGRCQVRVNCSRGTDEMTCLACNAYREAGGEGLRGMVEVNRTVLSRVSSAQWPNNICSVIYQDRQFSWTRDNPSTCTTRQAWENSKEASRQALREGSNGFDHFYASRINPSWARRCQEKQRIGNHVFCRISGVGVGALARAIPRNSGGAVGQTGSPTVQ